MRYAGALCPRCLKGINNEVQIEGHEDTKKRQLKRYGGDRLCNECLLYKVKEQEKTDE